MSNAETKGKEKSKKEKMTRLRHCLLFFALCLSPFSFIACRQDMQDQPRYEQYERNRAGGGTASRIPPQGTVARGYLREDRAFYTATSGANANTPGAGGGNPGGGSEPTGAQTAQGGNPSGGTVTDRVGDTNNVAEFPFPVTMDVINRGQERYEIFCSMCHGGTGIGDGMVARRGFRASGNRPVPSYHEPRLREARVGYFYDVITNGFGTMPSYAAMIPPADRWAIVAYIRALQVSQGGALGPGGTVQSTIQGAPRQGTITGTGGAQNTAPAPQGTQSAPVPTENAPSTGTEGRRPR
jgi:mono/diheme cytochrome c family protein